MQLSPEEIFPIYNRLPSPDQLWDMSKSGRGGSDKKNLKVNAHVHLPPNFSAFDSVGQVVDLAAEESIDILGASNYYDFTVYRDFAELTARCGIFPLFGLEVISLLDEFVAEGTKINDPGNPGRMYICGKGITGFTPMSGRADELMGIIRRNDSLRMSKMAQKLIAVFKSHGLAQDMSEQAIVEKIARRYNCDVEAVYLQERHLAQAFQEVFFEQFEQISPTKRAEKLGEIYTGNAAAVQGQLRTHLMKAGKSCFVEEAFLNFSQAFELILELGGIPCYPTLADGANPICPYEDPVEKLIDNLKQNNIHCAELIPIRNQPDVLAHYAIAMRRAGIVLVCGTEHNTPDLIPILPSCIGGKKIPAEIMDIFIEGACVVAAHQYLAFCGQCGFTDSQGMPNSAWKTAEQRISAFADFGFTVIQKYKEITQQ